MNVWQIAAGPMERSYAKEFVEYGVALIGPGDAGPWSADGSDAEFGGSFVRRFASELAVGDVVLLRIDRSCITAVGIVASDYRYLSAFDDVNGWDLQHARRVRWGRLAAAHDFGGPVFGALPRRCSIVHDQSIIDFAMRFIKSPPTAWQSAPLPALPIEPGPLEPVPASIAGIVAKVADLLPLMRDAQGYGETPSEDELIVHFVVPFLLALGWPPELIAVKWHYIDVALFRCLPRTPANCHTVIEAKRLGSGVEGALEQAQGYVAALGVHCNVLVTDGVRYRLYHFGQELVHVAYANLERLKQPAVELFTQLQRP